MNFPFIPDRGDSTDWPQVLPRDSIQVASCSFIDSLVII